MSQRIDNLNASNGCSDQLAASLLRLQAELDCELRLDHLTRTIYSTDASAYQETPLAVAFPKNESQIRKLILFARQHGLGLIPRTAGTSLAGQVVGSGIVVDVSRHFCQILEIDSQAKTVRVQPGVIRDELNQELAKHGLLFGPETSTANRAMIGGMVGNNSCGSNSVVYGSTRDHTLELRGLLSDGTVATFRAVSSAEIVEKLDEQRGDEEARIYQQTIALLDDESVQDEIRKEFPKSEIDRRNTGYAIDLLIAGQPFSNGSDRPFDFCKLLAGSEGTLFFVTEIKLNCVPLPPPVSGLQCAHFESVDEALRATLEAVKFQPYAVELMDHLIIEGAMRNREQRENASFIDGTPGAILVTEIRGQSRGDVTQVTDCLEQSLREQSLGYHFPVLFDDETRKVWDLRKAGLGIVANIPGDEKPVAVIEDTAVAVADLPDYIREFNQILNAEFGLECVHYAHAGSGEIHLRPILNLKTQQGNDDFRRVAKRIATLVKAYRGSLSGEHGDGRLRGEFLAQMVGEKNYQLIRQIKSIWDPQNVFNPQKIVDTPPMNTGLRYRPGQATHELETVFDFSAEQGLQRAAELCNGSGDCRKTERTGGTMCPSYMATRNEADTTRARANMLRHVLTNPDDASAPLNNDDLYQVMDLCLSCKGCKRECPSNVDIGKMKAEFLQAYYDTNGVPKRATRIANYATQMAWASNVPWLFNWLVSNRWTSSWIKRIAGFSQHRSIPKLQRQTLRRWFAKHQPHAHAGSRGKVILFCDEFTNFNDTRVGIAAIELIERFGFSVEMPLHNESGRAAMSKGLLRKAQKHAKSNVELFSQIVDEQTPLIGIEPSAVLSFRDEYLSLVGDDLKAVAETLSRNVLMFDEWIARLISTDVLAHEAFTQEKQLIRLHGHCHQKALASLKPTVQMLQLPKNYSVKLIPSGCCGMAGSFGYEVEHYDVSMQVGELVLLPTVRNEPERNLIAAPGTSCRHQILDGTGRLALHPVEILRQAWAGD
ncbi:MAG: FAD-linked oxidase C-terminal domain-containing protein [Planctomycetota bacterium]